METYKFNVNNKELSKTVAKVCRKWRLEQGIKQNQIGKDLGVQKNIASSFERGISTPLYVFMWYLFNGFDPLESEELWQLLKK